MTPAPWNARVNHIKCLLNNVFHHSSFQPHQLDVHTATLSGEDCFVVMATGGGKSLLYQLPALYERPKVTVVVSPLTALIEEQVIQMNKIEHDSAILLTSRSTPHMYEVIKDPNSLVCLVYVTPEKIHKSCTFQKLVKQLSDCD